MVAIVTASGKLKRLQAKEADNVVQYDGHGLQSGLQSGLLSSFFCARTYLKRWVLFSITNFKIAVTMAITALETLVLRGDQSLFEIVTQEFNKKLGKVE